MNVDKTLKNGNIHIVLTTPKQGDVMQVNGRQMSCEGLTYAQVGEKLQEACPNPNGVGLQIVLTQGEEDAISCLVGIYVGRLIAEVIIDAIKAKGIEPEFQYSYKDFVFTTTPIEGNGNADPSAD